MENFFIIWIRIYESVLFYLNSPEWQMIFFYLKIFSIIISVILGIGVIYLLIKINFFSIQKENLIQALFEKTIVLPKRKINKKWLEILKHIESKNYKLAIIDCNKLLEDILKKMAIKGENMAEKLSKINKEQLSTIEELKQAHKIRNQIVHNVDYQLSEKTALKVIDIYKKTFQELELIEND